MSTPVGEQVYWYHEENGQQVGPESLPVLVGLLRSGRIGPETRVWRAGMAAWQPARSVPELAQGLGQPLAPPDEPLQPIDVTALVLLGIVTLGIYPLVKFYQAGKSYQGLVPGRRSNFEVLFWVYVGAAVLGAITSQFGVGFVFLVADLVVGVFLLNEVLALRDEGVRARSVTVPLTSASTHRVLWILGSITVPFVVGVVLLIVQAVKFFRDHNALAAALGPPPFAGAWAGGAIVGPGGTPPPGGGLAQGTWTGSGTPPASSSASSPSGSIVADPPPERAAAPAAVSDDAGPAAEPYKRCTACGVPLAVGARYCSRCGAAAPAPPPA